MKRQHYKKDPHAAACGSFSFPGKIISLPGAAVFARTAAKGKTVLLADRYVFSQFNSKIRGSAADEMEYMEFKGGCSPGNFYKVKTMLLEKEAKTLIAAGGGKTLDLAKYLKREMPGLFLINVPTSAATCAAATPVSVLYDEKGVYMDTLDTVCPDILILDHEIFYDLPMPFFAAGAIDTLAKYYEAAAYCENIKNPDPYDLFILETIKRSCEKLKTMIMEKWRSPDNDLKAALAELIICDSGKLSCAGRYTVMAGLAHALAHSVTVIDTAKEFLHGEHVAAALMAQEQYLKNAARLSEVENLCAIMELPVSFKDIGIIDTNLPEVEKLCKAIISREKIFVPEREVLVYNVIESQYY